MLYMVFQLIINSSFGTLSFGVDSNGKAYYKIGGADTEYPFKNGNDVKVVSLSGTGRVSKNIDFSYLTNYSELTNDAFAVCPTGVQNYGSSPNTSLTISTSYNTKTGILTVTANEADGFRFNVSNVCVYVK